MQLNSVVWYNISDNWIDRTRKRKDLGTFNVISCIHEQLYTCMKAFIIIWLMNRVVMVCMIISSGEVGYRAFQHFNNYFISLYRVDWPAGNGHSNLTYLRK